MVVCFLPDTAARRLGLFERAGAVWMTPRWRERWRIRGIVFQRDGKLEQAVERLDFESLGIEIHAVTALARIRN